VNDINHIPHKSDSKIAYITQTTLSIDDTKNIINKLQNKFINIQGKSSGKGLSGSHKRHNFARGPMSHGSKNHRKPGSIGMGTDPGRVFPGKKMPGQLGNKITSLKKLKVVRLDLEENILIVRGSVPGKPGNLLSITLTK
jgi:large subunit ribosomal protein L3